MSHQSSKVPGPSSLVPGLVPLLASPRGRKGGESGLGTRDKGLGTSFLLLLLAACGSAPTSTVQPLPPEAGDESHPAIAAAAERELASLVELYKWFHANPELSLKEEKTSAKFAAEVAAAGWEITDKVGGFGVMAVLRNGPGPVLLVRIDMDALPVKEETGLPYTATGDAMHACGHDIHLASGIALARILPTIKDRWSGTVLLIGQPAEELGLGAKRMIADPRFAGVIAKCGKPSWCLSLHDTNGIPAGSVALCPGWATANVDSVDITVFGKGGHGAYPHQAIDPIVIASEIVTALQTVVSRRTKPGTPAVVTVGSFHGGTKHNIIPAEVKLQLTVRSYENSVREKLLEEIRVTAESIARAHRAPRDPEMKIDPDWCPAGYHDPALTERMTRVFKRLLGDARVKTDEPVMGGEDFSYFPRHFGVAGLQYKVGGANPAGEAPSLHSSKWAPVPEPTLRAAAITLTRSVLELLPRR